MGIKASATCVMNFDGATGFLIGPPNKGLECMFTFTEQRPHRHRHRGRGHRRAGLPGALAYARERRSMRALSGTKEPDQVADSLMHHGDVRRMLLTQKAIAEGGRALVYLATQYADRMIQGILSNDDAEYERWDDKLGFLTPILKGCLTELGLEAPTSACRCSAATAISANTAWSRSSATRGSPPSTKAPPASRPSTCSAARSC